jgi:peptidoglycan/xylan/chitin deacetylase (PgdA/CDA1 family)
MASKLGTIMLAPLIPPLYSILRTQFPNALWHGRGDRPHIALTFDDGPHPQYTLELLEVLAQFQVKATFFWLGLSVERFPRIARAVVDQGHWIGMHGYTHRPFIGMGATQLQQDLERTRWAIAQTCSLDPDRILDVRPPYGVCSQRTLGHLRSWGYRPVMWSVVPVDWTCPGVAIVGERVLRHTQAGSIIVLHDGVSGGADVAAATRQFVLPLLEQGFSFQPIDYLWAD